MADKVVFLVHGMGVHGPNWEKHWVKALRTHFEAFPNTRLTHRSFEQRFELVPVTYDDMLSGLFQRWKNEGFALDLAIQQFGSQPGTLNAIRDLLTSAGGADFFWTHAADVILYRASSLVRDAVKAHVAHQIVSKLKELAGNEGILPSWSVIAHSLGTAVVHDALDAIWTGQIPEADNRFDPRRPGAQAGMVMMVANVSRVLQHNPKVYVSTVMPGPPETTVPHSPLPPKYRGCRNYLSIRHTLDPFTIPGRFRPEPPPWPDSATQAADPRPYLEICVDHIHDFDVHSFEHYLANPTVHIELFRRLIHETAIGRDKEREAVEAFGKLIPLNHDDAITGKTRLEQLIPAADDLWPIIGNLWKKYREHLGATH